MGVTFGDATQKPAQNAASSALLDSTHTTIISISCLAAEHAENGVSIPCYSLGLDYPGYSGQIN